MILLQSISAGLPWWAALAIAVCFVISAIINVLQLWKSKDAVRWKASAEAWEAAAKGFEAERNTVREVRDRQSGTILDLTAQLEVCKAKTDLNGLREEVRTKVGKLTEEFKLHSEQDVAVANQQIEALGAVNATLKIIQGQMTAQKL